ncbi:MAG TPA: M23 family metallopeptidase [Candidatus Binatia bacterium]|nr:M23 family metallopeptidase [Candidatus Binatia bacterium]
MRRLDRSSGGGLRRVQHAHRVRQPVGALDPRSDIRLGRTSHRLRHGVPSIIAVAGLALVLAALQPWGTGLAPIDVRVAEARRVPAAAGRAADPGVVVRDPAPALGPHGDRVAALDRFDDNHATGRDVRRGGPLRLRPMAPELLTGYVWPIRNARITNTYGLGRPGNFRLDGVRFHDGIDVSSFCGARITAAHDGVVLVASRHHETTVGWVGDLAPFRERMERKHLWRSQAIAVVIDDGNGYRSVYAHLGLAAVEKGDIVQAGDLIGWEGASGNATGCHLHYSLFSPLETATLALDPKVAKKTKLPAQEIARVDPMLVLPPPSEAGISWGWGAR